MQVGDENNPVPKVAGELREGRQVRDGHDPVPKVAGEGGEAGRR